MYRSPAPADCYARSAPSNANPHPTMTDYDYDFEAGLNEASLHWARSLPPPPVSTVHGGDFVRSPAAFDAAPPPHHRDRDHDRDRDRDPRRPKSRRAAPAPPPPRPAPPVTYTADLVSKLEDDLSLAESRHSYQTHSSFAHGPASRRLSSSGTSYHQQLPRAQSSLLASLPSSPEPPEDPPELPSQVPTIATMPSPTPRHQLPHLPPPLSPSQSSSSSSPPAFAAIAADDPELYTDTASWAALPPPSPAPPPRDLSIPFLVDDDPEWDALPAPATGVYEAAHTGEPTQPRRERLAWNLRRVMRDPDIPAAQKTAFMTCLLVGKTSRGAAVGLEKLNQGVALLGWVAERVGDRCEGWAADMKLAAPEGATVKEVSQAAITTAAASATAVASSAIKNSPKREPVLPPPLPPAWEDDEVGDGFNIADIEAVESACSADEEGDDDAFGGMFD